MSPDLLIHVAAGFAALIAMLVAFAVKKGGRNHKLAGKGYVWAMAVSLAMGLLVSVRTENIFLALISVFSAYFVYTGWRLGARRGADVTVWDKIVIRGLMVTGAAMTAFGAWMLIQREEMGVVLIVFGLVAVLFAWSDRGNLSGWPTGKERIRMHVGRMGGAAIATLTAPTVVNIRTDPEFISWLAPGIIVTPLIFYWSRRVAQGKMTLRDAP